MLTKSQCIVLQTIKHSDSGIIAHVLSKQYGLISLMVKGVHSKKRGHMSAYFQSLQILNIELYYRENRNLQSVKEVSLAHTLNNIPYEYSRNTISYFIGEVLRKTLNEDEPNDDLYDFVLNSILYLDSSEVISNFHIGFLIGFAKYLGISPSNKIDQGSQFFDMQNGFYSLSPPLHGYYMDRKYSELLDNFSNSSLSDCNAIPLNGSQRSEFLDILLTYYSLHLPGLNRIKSLEVLSELFKL